MTTESAEYDRNQPINLEFLCDECNELVEETGLLILDYEKPYQKLITIFDRYKSFNLMAYITALISLGLYLICSIANLSFERDIIMIIGLSGLVGFWFTKWRMDIVHSKINVIIDNAYELAHRKVWDRINLIMKQEYVHYDFENIWETIDDEFDIFDVAYIPEIMETENKPNEKLKDEELGDVPSVDDLKTWIDDP